MLLRGFAWGLLINGIPSQTIIMNSDSLTHSICSRSVVVECRGGDRAPASRQGTKEAGGADRGEHGWSASCVCSEGDRGALESMGLHSANRL
jgi:hypothetical protein